MLANLLLLYRKQFNAVATAWLAAGAAGFSIRDGNKTIATWPEQIPPNLASTTTPLITADGQVIGELVVTGRVQGTEMRLAADAAILMTFISLGNEIEGLTSALSETEDQMLSLYELTKADTNRLHVDYVLSSLAQQATRLVRAEGAFVFLYPTSVAQTFADATTVNVCQALLDRLNLGGHGLLSRAEVPIGCQPLADYLYITQVLVNEAGIVTAFLGLWLNRPAAKLSPDLKLARSIALQGGAQLEIALLHQEMVAKAKLQAELALARQVQLGLLPKVPLDIAGAGLFARCHPALQVGGDFYDFYLNASQQNQRHLTFSVGDISGKGLSAALLMAMMRTTLRVNAVQLGNTPSPERMLSRANADLYDDFSEVGMMASVFVAHYDIEQQLLTYANAGHSPVLLCATGSKPRLLLADGPFLGVLPDCLSCNQQVPFQPGDILVVLSDGFNEARNAEAEFFGIERLEQLVAQLASKNAVEIGERLFAEIHAYTLGLPQDDDQTALILKAVELSNVQ